MKNNIKVNLGCWLASQFKMILTKKNKLLIFGSFITHFLVRLGVLDLQNHDLHMAYDMEFLDEDCLEKMGLVERVNRVYQFTLPGLV